MTIFQKSFLKLKFEARTMDIYLEWNFRKHTETWPCYLAVNCPIDGLDCEGSKTMALRAQHGAFEHSLQSKRPPLLLILRHIAVICKHKCATQK